MVQITKLIWVDLKQKVWYNTAQYKNGHTFILKNMEAKALWQILNMQKF